MARNTGVHAPPAPRREQEAPKPHHFLRNAPLVLVLLGLALAAVIILVMAALSSWKSRVGTVPTNALAVQETEQTGQVSIGPVPGGNPPAQTEPEVAALATIPIVQGDWQSSSPGGSHQVWPAYDRVNPNMLYLGQASVGFWVSEDGGKTWELIGREIPSTHAVNTNPSQAEYDELNAYLRSQIVPHMQDYRKGLERTVGLGALNAEGEYALATLVWIEDAEKVVDITQTYRFLVSLDRQNWVEVGGPPVNLNQEVYITLIRPTSKGVRIYIGGHSGTLWQTEIRHEAISGLIQ